jgi:lysozyme
MGESMTLTDQLTRDEGCKLKVYKDTKGILTIGVGRNLEGNGISLEEAQYLLANDIRNVQAACTANFSFFKALDEVRQGVLVNMGFMGVEKLKQFHKMLAAIEAGDWQTAAKEMLDSKYATDVGDRAKRLAQQLITGEWQ